MIHLLFYCSSYEATRRRVIQYESGDHRGEKISKTFLGVYKDIESRLDVEEETYQKMLNIPAHLSVRRFDDVIDVTDLYGDIDSTLVLVLDRIDRVYALKFGSRLDWRLIKST